jgi:mono/diheme cytochrome c family protein
MNFIQSCVSRKFTTIFRATGFFVFFAFVAVFGVAGPSSNAEPGQTQDSGGKAAAGNAKNGQKLFLADGCYECHGREGQGSRQTSAPRIGPTALPFDALARYVRQPSGGMPPYSVKALSDSDLTDIYAFLESVPKAPPGKSIPLLNQ